MREQSGVGDRTRAKHWAGTRIGAALLCFALLPGCGWATAAIIAATAGGGGGSSSSSPAPAPGDTEPPSIPTQSPATVLSPYAIRAQWAPSTDNVTPASELRYDIYVHLSSGQFTSGTPFARTDPGATSFIVGGLVPNTAYWITVTAVDAAGNSSLSAGEEGGTTPTAPAVSLGSSAGLLVNPRHSHGAGLLTDGKILVAGGLSLTSIPTATSELYDPAAGTWSSTTGNIGTARYDFPLVVMDNGRALIAGGRNGSTYYTIGQIYDPTTSTWTTTTSISTARAWSTGTLLRDGRVVIAGGGNASNPLSAVDIYDPSTGTWTTGNNLTTPRQEHAAVLLQDGRILISGGSNSATTDTNTAEIFNPATGTWSATGAMSTNRFGHTLTLLPKGKVLAVGGGTGSTGLATCELYDPATGTWTTRAGLGSARTDHTATLLPAGRVLVLSGAASPGGTKLNTSQIYTIRSDSWAAGPTVGSVSHHSATLLPSGQVAMVGGDSGATVSGGTNLIDHRAPTWRTTGSLATVRYNPMQVVLPDGRVLVAGGQTSFSPAYASSCELYDSTTGTWTATGSLSGAWVPDLGITLPSGQVLAAAGYDATSQSSAAALYDPATGTWTATGSLNGARNGCAGTLLPDGRVLAAAGATGSQITTCELYDPAQGTWLSTGSMATARWQFSVNVLLDGRVLAVGGEASSTNLSSCELYDPASGTWSTTGSLLSARRMTSTFVLPDGRVLAVGGVAWPTSCELWNPATGTWTLTGALTTGRNEFASVMLPGGRVMVAGGYNGSNAIATTEFYDPATGTWSPGPSLPSARQSPKTVSVLRSGEVLLGAGLAGTTHFSNYFLLNRGLGYSDFARPVISTVNGAAVSPAPLTYGSTVTITGVRFRGVSEGGGGGSRSAANDLPIVTLSGPMSGRHGYFDPGSDHAFVLPASGFAGGTSCTVQIPATGGLHSGYYQLRVTVGGVPSEAWIVRLQADGAFDASWIGNGVFNFDPSAGQDIVHDLASDGTSLYVVGSDSSTPRQWRIEKRSLATGALDGTFGGGTGIVTVPLSTGTNEPRAVVHDGTHLYICGFDEQAGAGDPQWRIEKRLMTTGALVNGFGTSGVVQNNISAGNDTATALVHDGTNLYVVGNGGSGIWHIEKRLMSTGALVTGFGTNGVISFQPTTGLNSVPNAVLSDGTNIYVCGYDNPSGTVDWRVEKRLASTGALVNGFGTSGVLNVSTGSSDTLHEAAHDGTNFYLCGQRGGTTWDVEKRSLATGALDSTFGSGSGVVSTNPSAGADSASCITLDNGFLYVGGYDTLSGNRATRIVKRNATTGALVPTFGAGGVVRRDIAGGNDELLAILVDGNFLFAAGYDGSVTSTQWHLQKRSK